MLPTRRTTLLAAATILAVRSPVRAADPVRIAAAANLRDVLDQIVQASEKAGGARLVVVYGATGNLARQIERYADIYLSRVSNFAFHTPFVYLRSPRGSLPHDPLPRHSSPADPERTPSA